MFRYLVALIWPVGMVVIAGAAFIASRRSQIVPDVPAGPVRGAANGGRGTGRHHSRRTASGSQAGDAVTGSAKLIAVAVAGAIATFAVICLLGLLVVHHGHVIDKPVFNWIQAHRVHAVAAAMQRLTKFGDTWTTWGAAAAAAVCLAVAGRERRWLAPVSLAAVIVIDHFTTLALRHVFERPGPPTSPFGTYPSGGCDRCIVFYGLIAYLIWREFSGRRGTAIWAGAAVAALGFNEAFSRVYLSLHWLTDALSGLLYGGLLLAGFILAVRMAGGRSVPARTDSPPPPVSVGLSPAEGPLT